MLSSSPSTDVTPVSSYANPSISLYPTFPIIDPTPVNASILIKSFNSVADPILRRDSGSHQILYRLLFYLILYDPQSLYLSS